jgi:serine/threonine-protein kinase
MPLSTMSEFLEGLYNSRLFDRAQIEQLLHQPSAANGDIPGIADYVVAQGWATRYQIEEIRAGRGETLFFASYRILDQLEPTVAGRRLKVYHPALQKPVALTLLRPEWLLPYDSLESFLPRAQRVSTVESPHLVQLLDAGILQETPFLLEEYVDGTDLGYLINEMGAVPGQLGCDFIRQACLGLQALHERGLVHGDLHPGNLILSPVTRYSPRPGQVEVRPGPGATVRIQGSGTTPARPPFGQMSLRQSPLLKTIDFAPPERLTESSPTVRGDLYSLGACFYFLLAGRSPFRSANETEALWNLQYGKITPIHELRSDVAVGLSQLILRLLSRQPGDRPASVFEVLAQLQMSNWNVAPAPFAPSSGGAIPQAMETASFPSSLGQIVRDHNQPPPFSAPVAPTAPVATFPAPPAFPSTAPPAFPSTAPPAFPSTAPPLPEFTPSIPRPKVEPLDSSRLGDPYSPRQLQDLAPSSRDHDPHDPHDPFGLSSPPGEHDSAAPRPRRAQPKKKIPWLWIVIGLLLHATGVILLIGFLAGWFEGSPEPKTPKNEIKKNK